MKKPIFLFLVVSLVCSATLLYAREDHRAYSNAKIRECTECHRDANVSPNHQGAWNAQHGVIAVKPDAPCADCHDRSYCTDCHFGGGIDAGLHVSQDRGPNYKPKSHRSSFLEVHPIAAFDSPNSCQRCHPASFCSECHARFQPQDLMFQSHRKGWSDRPAVGGGPAHSTFPPDSCLTCHPNSVLPSHVWSGSHAREARRNLPTCQSCHSDGETCLKCHSAKSGLRVNPHPDNWGSIQGKLNKAAGQRTCVKCH
ncbi:MAG: cytochrome C [Deltaproteobacteria bacterium]|nr:cytochrome C [Deltaproteobacteria bacterium]